MTTTRRSESCTPRPVRELEQQLPQMRPAQGLLPAPLAPTPWSPTSSLLCLTIRPDSGFRLAGAFPPVLPRLFTSIAVFN